MTPDPARRDAVRELGDLTYEDVRALDRARTVAILPVGALEAHGPHLPLATDMIIAQGMARAGAARIVRHGVHVVVLPALPFTAAPFGAAFGGTISVAAATVTALILDLARELTRHGFGALAIANAHLDPAHLGALAEAVSGARAEGLLPVVAPDLTKKALAARLTEEFRSGACHAGRYEGSVVMALRPELVRDEIRRGLPANPSSLSVAIRNGVATFEEAGGPRAYFGWPADATAEEGRTTVESLGEILADAVLDAWVPRDIA
jgi:creatinine amidohydrolase